MTMDPHPLSNTASGGSITQATTLKHDILFICYNAILVKSSPQNDRFKTSLNKNIPVPTPVPMAGQQLVKATLVFLWVAF